MKFLYETKASLEGYNPSLFVKLKGEWKEPAQRFPKDRLPEVLKEEIKIANKALEESGLKQEVEIRTGEYGLSGISLSPIKAGIDLEPHQDSYISHNLTKATQIAALEQILIAYIKNLEYIKI